MKTDYELENEQYFDEMTCICPICGREFYPQSKGEWAYKDLTGLDNLYYCSWSCYRKRDPGKQYNNVGVRHGRKAVSNGPVNNEGNACWNCSKLAKCPMTATDKTKCFQPYIKSLREFSSICKVPLDALFYRIRTRGLEYLHELAKENGLVVKVDDCNGRNRYIIYKETNND